jgi:hypothetical protein
MIRNLSYFGPLLLDYENTAIPGTIAPWEGPMGLLDAKSGLFTPKKALNTGATTLPQ